MRTTLRIFLLILAFVSVCALGYYAYNLEARTLSFALDGTELQKGNTLYAVFDRPVLAGSGENIIIKEAIASSLILDGKPLVDTGSIDISLDGDTLNVRFEPTLPDKKQVLTIKAALYNAYPGVNYRLPSDIILETGEAPTISVEKVGLPKDKKYTLDLIGFPKGIDIDMMKLYQVKKDPELGQCEENRVDFGQPVGYDILDIYRSTSKETVNIVSRHTIVGAYCLYAGLSGKLYEIDNEEVGGFTLTGNALDILAPEYDMKSRIEFTFSNPIFEDEGDINSREYIAHRTKEKELLLKHIILNPDIPLSINNLVLTPTRAVLTLPLEAGMNYSLKIENLEDIYGQTSSLTLPLSPKREPYLSLVLSGNTTTLPVSTPVWAKMYAMDTKRLSHNVMLCRVPVEIFARFERIVDENKSEYSDEMYTTLAKLSKDACIKKEVLTQKNNHLSQIDISSFFPKNKQTSGLYILAFADKGDSIYTSKWLRPLLFSLLDTHITMKLDASGKALFFATDMSTAMPVAGQEIRIFKNIGRSYIEEWNPTTEKVDINYLPLSTVTYSTGISLGKTDTDGFLSVDIKDKLDGDSPYGFTYESWWGYEGSYRSFLVESRGEGSRLGYVVSTWNDGIAGWNFGFKEEDYGWSSTSPVLAYTHTDRRLYLPGDTVNIHAIIRDYTDKLILPPQDRTYTILISDPSGKEVSRTLLKSTEFGSLSQTWKLPPESVLGLYTAQVVITDKKLGDIPIDGGYTNFQVEVFKNPTFSSQVTVSSSDINSGIITNLEKKKNTDSSTYWYKDIYQGNFNLDAKITASYYNGAMVRNVPFTYRVYRSEYWGDALWNDCFWGCYYEPPLDFYTEGEGHIDSDGYGFVRVPVLFSSFYADYKYVVEVTIQDPLSGETVSSAGNMIVRLPSEYRMWDTSNPLTFKPDKKIISQDEVLSGSFIPSRGKWSKWHEGKYRYDLFLRTYDMTEVDDIRGGKSEVMHPVDTLIGSGSITRETWSMSLKGKPSGEYHIRVHPSDLGGTGVLDGIGSSDTIVYYVSTDKNAKNPRIANNAISVIAEKTVYHIGENARILVRLPWENSKVLLTIEKNGVIEKKYMDVKGNMFEYNFPIDDRFIPNAYIGVVAFSPTKGGGLPEYRVGYTEIVTDMTDKKAVVSTITDKKEYKTREKVKLNISLQDVVGKPLQGEVAVMVVDESLIALLGNIDLDIIPKFYQKLPFSLRTALSLIGMEERRYFSRNGIAGGSGGKGGDGSAISSRILFQNTAYYNPSVITDAGGKATLEFSLPDNITNYRIITIANTRDSRFGVSESTINVRKDYVIEPHAPTIVRKGDSFIISANVFNNTDRITGARLTLKVDGTVFTGSSAIDIRVQPRSPENIKFTLRNISEKTSGTLPFTLTLSAGKNTLDSIEGFITLATDPMFENRKVQFYEFTGSSLSIPIEYTKTNIDLLRSRYTIDVSTSVLSSSRTIFQTLLEYPYGCAEQTTSSTLPNAIALATESLFPTGVDSTLALKNINSGIDRLRSMQLPSGGFAYWIGETTENPEVTPYVVRSLLILRSLGVAVPSDMIENGLSYLVNNEALYTDANSQAERFWTLALAKDKNASKAKTSIDTSKLSLHGWVAYLYGLQLSGSLPPRLIEDFQNRYLSKKNLQEDTYWYYWNREADMMIFARMLLDRGEKRDIIFHEFLKDAISKDWNSYYLSTQEKLQTFLTLVRYLQLEGNIEGSIKVGLRSGVSKSEGILSKNDRFFQRRFELGKVDTTLTLEKNNPRSLYITTTATTLPKDPYSVPAKMDAGVTIRRIIEKIDEKLGVDIDGRFLSAVALTGGIFEKGNLYRVRLEVSLPQYKDKSWTNFVLEDYLPGGWRPISSNFLTNSSLLENNTSSLSRWNWTHIESRMDRVFANAGNGYGDTISYEYFIRPDTVGSFMLPPATGYFMYRPELRGYSTYEKITVR